MATRADKNGTVWEIDAQGNPLRPVSTPQAPATIYGRPKPVAAPTPMQVEDQGFQRQAASNANAAASIAQAKADRETREWDAAHNPDGTLKPKAGSSGSLDPKTQDGQSNIAHTILSAAGVSGDVDPVADLIKTSTSGKLQAFGAGLYGSVTGEATDGMEDIGRLETIANDMVLQMSGGSLGAQISDGDRKFIAARMGDVGNPEKPYNQRLAAWDQVKQRLRVVSGGGGGATQPVVPANQSGGATVAPSSGNSTAPPQGGVQRSPRPQGGLKGLAWDEYIPEHLARDTAKLNDAFWKGATAEQLAALPYDITDDELAGGVASQRDTSGWANLATAIAMRDGTGKFKGRKATREEIGNAFQPLPVKIPAPRSGGGRNENDNGFEQKADAALIGVADVLMAGGSDEFAAASDTLSLGGTLEDNLRRQRAVRDFDEENNFGARLTGQIAGGFALPAGRMATAGQGAKTAAAYGATYGFGSTDGGIGERLIGAAKGGAAGAVAGAAGGAIANRIASGGGGGGGGGNSASADILNAAARQDIKTLPADTGGVASRLASGMTSRTLGGIPMAQAAEAAVTSAQSARNRVAESIGRVTDETGAGQAAQKGLREFLGESKNRGGGLFEATGIPGERQAVTAGSKGALQEVTTGLESNHKLSQMFDDPRLKGYLEALAGTTKKEATGVLDAGGRPITRSVQEGGSISFDDLKRFRSKIGEMIEQPQVAGEKASKRDLRRLYAGISDDLEATAAAEGPEALTAMRRANQYWRGRESRREGIIQDILGKNFDEGGRAAYDQINRWAQDKGDFAKVARLLRSMPEDEANAVRATMVSNLGKASKGRQDATGQKFSPAEFATNWAGLSERAKAFLFKDTKHRAALEDIATVTNAMKRAEQFSNFSNTGAVVNGITMLAGVVTNLPATLLVAATQLGAGKFLSRDMTARWIARLAKQEKSANSKWLSRHVRQLDTLADQNPNERESLMELKSAMEQILRKAA